MMFLISAIAFILLLTLLIIIHELGHYAVARFFKVEVEEFGFGLPPKAKVLFKSGKTLFTLNWIPFGGFVRLKGENEMSVEKRHEKGSFASASFLARILILCGGVFMNFVLAFALLTFGFSVGRWVPDFYASIEHMEEAATRGEIFLETGVYIREVLTGGGAEKAGVIKDSILQSVDGVPVSKPADVVAAQAGKNKVTYVLLEGEGEERRPKTLTIELTDGKSGAGLGVYFVKLSAPVRPVLTAVSLALKQTQFMTVQTVKGMSHLVASLVTKGNVPEGITGIVGIFVLTSSSVQEGLMTYLRLVALLSLSLAILNILPFPALDGGRLLFIFIEMIIGRPLNQRFELLANAIGFSLLILLIVIITFNDVIHLFS